MHYLIMGNNQKRLPQLLEYLALFKTGTATDAAFRTAFGDDPSVLDNELRSYVSQYSVLELRQTFDDRVETAIPQRGEKIDDLEADTYLGDLQARLGRIDEARARLQKVLERRPRDQTMARCRARSGGRSSVGWANSSTPAMNTPRR
jgi:tetratricopeptide (TPR) repeat protein